MGNSSQSAVLWLEISAALMMGLDYFFGRSLLTSMNRASREYLRKVRSEVDKDIASSAKSTIDAWPSIVVGIVMLLSFIALLQASVYLFSNNFELLGLVASVIALFAFCISIYSFLTSLFPSAIKLAMALPFRLGTMILLASPKGPIAAAGFGALMLSLWLKYQSI